MDFIVPKYHKQRTSHLDNLCIPRIEKQTPLEYIIQRMNVLGEVIQIQETPLYNDPDYKRVTMTIVWNMDEKKKKIQRRLQEGKNIKMIHKEPWYWKIVLNRQK